MRASLLLAAVLGGLPAVAAGQGLVGGAIAGTVVSAEGSVAAGIELEVTDRSTGQRWLVGPDSKGRFSFDNLPVGASYRLLARAIGFHPVVLEGIRLTLGERYTAALVLKPAVLELPSIVVTASPDPRLNAGRTGPAQTVSDSTIRRLPASNRDVLQLVQESPVATDVTGGLSIGGQNPRFNDYQIDGGVNNNLYGVFSSTPGGLLGVFVPQGPSLHTIIAEAVKDILVAVAPFDVRQSGFTGGAINLVTYSGSNEFHGTAIGSFQGSTLVGNGASGAPVADYTAAQFGATVGGPLIRDRLHFFLAVDLQRGTTPDPRTTTGPDSAALAAGGARFQQILSDQYGVPAGSFGPITGHNPSASVFGKVSAQLGTNSRLEVSENVVRGTEQGSLLSTTPDDSYQFGSRDLTLASTTATTRASWSAMTRGGGSSEMIGAYFHDFGVCQPATDYVALAAAADSLVSFGAGRSPWCPPQGLTQRAWQFTENYTLPLGAHRLTAGAHAEFLHFSDASNRQSPGYWQFDNLDSLEAGIASSFSRTLPGPSQPAGATADFGVNQFSLYLQDQWVLGHGVTLLAGLRADVPFFTQQPVTNPALLASLGIDTGVFPNGNTLWSPRLGVNYLTPDGATSLRGGVGLFTGRPAFFLPAQAFMATGLELLELTCTGSEVPAFTVDLSAQPTACRTAGGTAPVPEVTFVDPGYKFPQVMKLSAGIDRRLPWGMVGTLDLLYTRSSHQPFYSDENLVGPIGSAAGEGGRLLYGSIDAGTGVATPARRDPNFGSVVRQSNRSGDYSASFTVQVQRPLTGRVGFNASYTWSNTEDLISQLGLGQAVEQIAITPLNGPLADPVRAPSLFDVTHRFRVSGTVALPLRTSLSLIYERRSGTPYTYVVEGDANADGFGEPRIGQQSNDVFFVPTAPVPGGDIVLVAPDPATGLLAPAPAADYEALANFIASQPCLSAQRGQLMHRNSCRNPWEGQLNLRLAATVSTGRGQTLELMADVFNFPNLLSSDWGLVRHTAFFGIQEVAIVGLRGFDGPAGRGVYQLQLPPREVVDDDASRWRVQLGARYSF